MKISYIILVLSLMLSSCTKQIESEQLQKRNNKYYEVNSDKPYSGEVIYHYTKGNSKELCTFENGKKIKAIGYRDDGSIAYEQIMGEKKEYSYKAYTKDGDLKIEEYTDKEGKRHGKYFSAYDDGKPKIQTSYIHGEFNGDYNEWYENGQLKQKMQYKKGVPEGKSQVWKENGELYSEANFEPNKVFSLRQIYREGKKDKVAKIIVDFTKLLNTIVSLLNKNEIYSNRILGKSDLFDGFVSDFSGDFFSNNQNLECLEYNFYTFNNEYISDHSIYLYLDGKRNIPSIGILIFGNKNYDVETLENNIKKELEKIGFDPNTGLNLEKRQHIRMASETLHLSFFDEDKPLVYLIFEPLTEKILEAKLSALL